VILLRIRMSPPPVPPGLHERGLNSPHGWWHCQAQNVARYCRLQVLYEYFALALQTPEVIGHGRHKMPSGH
jgi:hypothetical protein